MSRSRPASNPLSYHKHTGQYYVTRDGKRIYLGADRDEAMEKYHRMALGKPELEKPRTISTLTAKELANRFIAAQQANWTSSEIMHGYKDWLGRFLKDHPSCWPVTLQSRYSQPGSSRYEAVAGQFRKLCKTVGAACSGFYRLRHCASTAMALVTTPHVQRKFMRHSQLQQQVTYTHAPDAEVEDAIMKARARLLGGPCVIGGSRRNQEQADVA